MLTPQGPAHMMAVGNSLKEVVGLEHIKVWKMRRDSKSTVLVAMCCMTMLALNHPNLLPNCFDVNCEHVNIVCNDAKMDGSECQATCFTGDWDIKKDPKALPLPPSQLPAYPTIGKMMTSGYLFKFMGRLDKKTIKMPGDQGIEEISAIIERRDGPPMIAHAQQSDHLPAKGGWQRSDARPGVVCELDQ